MSKNTTAIAAALALAAIAGFTGNWWGSHHVSTEATITTMDSGAVKAPGKAPKLLFYRNPMGLPDTSPNPKKDPMGMDYVPVYEDEGDAEPASANQLKISADKVQKLGVKTEAAAMRVLDKSVRAAGRIEPDERRTYTVAPKFEGYVEKLFVNATGQGVSKGQPLFEVYSPDLVSAQREYAIASQGARTLANAGEDSQKSIQQLADASLARLRNWDISEEQVKELARTGSTKRSLTFRSPVSGIVTEKKAVQGMRFIPGESLYQITDLSSVWIVADVFEQDIAMVRTGARAKVKVNAYPDKVFEGAVSYIYPTLNAETRTMPVRVELANPGLLLKPGMFAEVDVPMGAKAKVLTVPISAVIDSGKRQIVLVQLGEGRFEPREVKVGARSDNYLEVFDGIKDGEQVVVSANFLIDAESNLKAAVAGFGKPAAPSDTASKDSVSSPSVGHQGKGRVVEVDPKDGSVTIKHEAIPSLKWSAMTMDFKVSNSALMAKLKPGTEIAFELVERAKGEWVITKVVPAAVDHSAMGY